MVPPHPAAQVSTILIIFFNISRFIIFSLITSVCLPAGASVKTEPGVEADASVKEEEKEEKKEKDEKREKDFIKKEEKEREREKEKEKERERPTRSSGSSNVIKEEKPGGSSQPEESAGERISMTGGSKRKEMEQLKIIRAELKYVANLKTIFCCSFHENFSFQNVNNVSLVFGCQECMEVLFLLIVVIYSYVDLILLFYIPVGKLRSPRER